MTEPPNPRRFTRLDWIFVAIAVVTFGTVGLYALDVPQRAENVERV